MAAVIISSLAFASPDVICHLKARSPPYSSISLSTALFPLKLTSASHSMKKLSSFTVNSYLTESEKTKNLTKQELEFAEADKLIPSTLENKLKENQTFTFQQLNALRKEMNSQSTLKDELEHYEVLKYPLATEAAMKCIIENNTLVFIVDTRANKKNIREAFQNMFNIRAKKVNTLLNCDGTKKAFLILSKDYNALDVAKKIRVI